jgi:hypothetical protein
MCFAQLCQPALHRRNRALGIARTGCVSLLRDHPGIRLGAFQEQITVGLRALRQLLLQLICDRLPVRFAESHGIHSLCPSGMRLVSEKDRAADRVCHCNDSSASRDLKF